MSQKNDILSPMELKNLVFDKLIFDRKNANRTDNKVQFGFGYDVKKTDDLEDIKVSLFMSAEKEEEYEILIALSGYFSIDNSDKLLSDETKKMLIEKNTLAILFPYLRSQLTILTSQPGVDPIVMPTFNINALVEDLQESYKEEN